MIKKDLTDPSTSSNSTLDKNNNKNDDDDDNTSITSSNSYIISQPLFGNFFKIYIYLIFI